MRSDIFKFAGASCFRRGFEAVAKYTRRKWTMKHEFMNRYVHTRKTVTTRLSPVRKYIISINVPTDWVGIVVNT